MSIKVVTISCLSDNYAYLIICTKTAKAVVLDPSSAKPVIDAIHAEKVELEGILNTHHCWDHTHGNAPLVKEFGQLRVYAHRIDQPRIPTMTNPLEDGQTFTVGDSQGRVIHTPGHTIGSVSYLVDDKLFVGDTMFSAGCGRVFEGTYQMMHDSLNNRLGQLSDSTEVYFGHEYTAANLRFALNVEPDNEQAQTTLANLNMPSTPSSLGKERLINPFLRCASPSIRSKLSMEGYSDVEVFSTLRKMKDRF